MTNTFFTINHTQLTAEDLANLDHYGCLTPQELAPEPKVEGVCDCGIVDCPTAYECITHGV